MNKFSLNLRGAMEAHQTSNLGVLSSSLSEDVFILNKLNTMRSQSHEAPTESRRSKETK